MTMPNFLVIGAAKCGTESLCGYLGQHPNVYMCPNREPNFFVAAGQGDIPFRGPGDREALQKWGMWTTQLHRYEALFAATGNETAIGEGTTWYLYDEHAPARIRHHIPAAQLIAILRNPVDRAYSAFNMLWRDGREIMRDFAQALAAEDKRVRDRWEPIWHYQRMGFYASQIKRYYDTFDAGQVRVVLYEDFNARPLDVLRNLFQFLQVDDQFEPDTFERRNVSLVPKYPTVHRLVAGNHPLKVAARAVLPIEFRRHIKPAPLPEEIRQQLMKIFRPDILELQTLLDRDLSHWLR
jgi:hypothetical protein